MGHRAWHLFRAAGALRIGSQIAYVFLIYARNLRSRAPARHLEIGATLDVPTFPNLQKKSDIGRHFSGTMCQKNAFRIGVFLERVRENLFL